MLNFLCLQSSESNEDRFNHVTAPFAASVILALAAEGAESDTKNQLIAAFGGELPDKDSYKDVLTSVKVSCAHIGAVVRIISNGC